MRSNCGFRIWLLLALALCPSAAFGQPALVFDTPEKLWRDFNPESPDLDIDSLRNGTRKESRSRSCGLPPSARREGRCRVFAIRGAPLEGSRLPGILHIHGGGQTASLDWVRYWAKRGYVCVTFDYTGPWAGRKEFTDWGPIKQGNLTDAARRHDVPADRPRIVFLPLALWRPAGARRCCRTIRKSTAIGWAFLA